MIDLTPSVTVVIPTHNRWASLQRTLRALALQSYPSQQTEVVVVADGCQDETTEMVQRYDAPFALTCIEQPGQGAAAARNQGAAKAAGRILIFIDDDVEPSTSLIEAHVRAHEASPGAVVMGPYVPVLHGRTDFFRMLMRAWWHDKFTVLRDPGHRFEYRDLLSGNLSLSAELFARTGGFDTAFRNCGGEDYEFGARLMRAGAPFVFASDATALHYEHETTDFSRFFKRAFQEGRSDVLIGRRHPDLIPTLPLFRFEPPRTVLDRAVHSLAFSHRRLGEALAAFLSRLLIGLEHIRFRMLWRRLCGGLRHYWYLRGAAEELKDQSGFAKFFQSGPHHPDRNDGEVQIDLLEGIQLAERRLDEERPAGIRICYGKQFIGRIPCQAGAERLRGKHLRSVLATQLAWPVLRAYALEAVFSGDMSAGVLLNATHTEDLSGGIHADQGTRSGVI